MCRPRAHAVKNRFLARVHLICIKYRTSKNVPGAHKVKDGQIQQLYIRLLSGLSKSCLKDHICTVPMVHDIRGMLGVK